MRFSHAAPRSRRPGGLCLWLGLVALGVSLSLLSSAKLSGNESGYLQAMVDLGAGLGPLPLEEGGHDQHAARLADAQAEDTGDLAPLGLALTAGVDSDYEAFKSCPKSNQRREGHLQWVFSEDVAKQEKRCTLTTIPQSIPAGVEWGPITTYNWNGDFGYWYDAQGVRDGRSVRPCARTRCQCAASAPNRRFFECGACLSLSRSTRAALLCTTPLARTVAL